VTGVRLRDLAPDDPAWEAALEVLRQLRTHLDPEVFARVHRHGVGQGLTFTGAFDDAGVCTGLAGWRVMDTMSVVRKLYVDDLVVDEAARSTGVGAALLAHLEERARAHGCRCIELDSGHQRARAHAFYRREGYTDTGLHFIKDLAG
jgi:GNAT superfamily N-acetyltransferase